MFAGQVGIGDEPADGLVELSQIRHRFRRRSPSVGARARRPSSSVLTLPNSLSIHFPASLGSRDHGEDDIEVQVVGDLRELVAV